MKRHAIMAKCFKGILIMTVLLFVVSPCTMAEDAAVEPASEPLAEEANPSLAPADKAASEMTALGAGGMATMSGGEQPPLPSVSPSAIGGAFSSLMSESFKTDLATGAATMGIPIIVPPGRKNVQPNVALSYSSNNPNGLCGIGWSVPISAIQRSTKNGVPRYDNIDTFIAGGEELVNIGGNEYRAKIESSFTKYVYVNADNKWIVYDKAGTQYHFGSIEASRLCHPNKPANIFAWYLDKAVDVYGNTITYTYEKSDNTIYPKYIDYTSNSSCNPQLLADKRVEFVYESAERPDKIYSYRAGWPSVIKRRLEKIRISINGGVIWTYNLNYVVSPDTSRSLLTSIQLEDGSHNTLPAKTFTYQRLD